MITLTVVSYNGQASDGRLSTQFDELGGTIGRADTNLLVLPDPDRTISRVHAQIVFRNGDFAIVDRGSNPIMVNGQALGSGREQRVVAGDRVQIGGYLLSVGQGSAGSGTVARPADPFADLLGPAAAVQARSPAAGPALIDPLAAFGGGSGNTHGPQTTPGVYNKASAPTPASAPPSMGGIPDDWDPFAPDPVAAPAPSSASPFGNSLGLDSGAGAAGPLIPGLGGGGPQESSLDNLFGLGPSSGGDPLANSRLDAPMAKPNMAANADPLASLNSAPLDVGQARQDNSSLLNAPFQLPPAPRQAPAPAAPLIPAPPPPANAGPLPSGAVLSWDGEADATHTVIRSPRTIAPGLPGSQPLIPPTSMQPMQQPQRPAPAPVQPPAPAPMAAPAPAPRAAMPSGDGAALLAAFRDGLGVPQLQIDSLTPELMRLIGQILHEAAAGTVDLLVARAALKREVRAEATMIVAKENNPLKFSPSAETALQHLLSPPARGFMPAAPAMKDAYDDLRAHQFGFVAGMRAALEGVLDRFDPQVLEGKLTQKSAGLLGGLLPGSRKARMWEVFTEHYEQISSEAEDDFHSLFGKAFLKAYEEHIDQLKGGGGS